MASAQTPLSSLPLPAAVAAAAPPVEKTPEKEAGEKAYAVTILGERFVGNGLKETRGS